MGLGAPGGMWRWRAENTQGQVYGPMGRGRARPPVSKPHTPPTTQAKTMGACAQPPGCRGQGQAPAGSSPAVPSTTPFPGPGVPGSPAFPEQPAPAASCPREPQPAPAQDQSPPESRGLGGSHHSAPPVALDSEIWAEEQVGDGQEQGLGQGPSILIIVLSLLGTEHPGSTLVVAGQGEVAPGLGGREEDGVWAQAGSVGRGMKEEAGEGKGSELLITPNLPRQKETQGWMELGTVRNPPIDWEGTGRIPLNSGASAHRLGA